MLHPVEVCHEGRWIPATLMAVRRDEDGGYGLVGYTDPDTKAGYYRWVHESLLQTRRAALAEPLERHTPSW